MRSGALLTHLCDQKCTSLRWIVTSPTSNTKTQQNYTDPNKTLITWSHENISEFKLYPSVSRPLILQFLVVLADQISSDSSLEVGDDLRKAFIAHVFQHTEDSSFEEDLRVAQAVVVCVQLEGTQNLLAHNLSIAESGRDHIWSQDRISAINFNSPQHTIV